MKGSTGKNGKGTKSPSVPGSRWNQNGSRTFDQASAEIQANLQRHIERQKSRGQNVELDSGEESEEAPDEVDEAHERILAQMFQSYGMAPESVDARTRSAVLQSFSSGTHSCLICISSIKKSDPIWNCGNCFCSLHITCVQRWARDSIFQQKQDQELNSHPDHRQIRQGIVQSPPSNAWRWCCPNCRHAFGEREIPAKYTCYCGKVDDPTFDPWIAPHSCGETCDRRLKPECGHSCLILCHPGPCPPCPKMVTAPCFCRNSAPAMRRCFDRTWSCGKPCSRPLNCAQHPCPRPCHDGPCPPCQKTSVQLCQCQRHQKESQCAEPVWQCTEKCGRKLKCGHHVCDTVCHKGACPPCPLSELRYCPCRKQTYQLACTLATPTCGDTCGKTLSCGEHICSERCHRGACGSCLQMILKPCRCGMKQKEVPCTKDYVCDMKCRRMKDCRKHTCNKKCCDGSCPPCEQPCGKMLSCKNHKCESRCHIGTCYPCNQTKEVACNCGTSRILVPCGREKVTHPPKCRQKCQAPSNCHHPARTPHNCHFGNCPPCKQPCGQTMACQHICPAPCHDQVKVKINPGKKAAVPWEETGPKIETKTLACPDCQVPVPVTCLGGHDTSDYPCFMAKMASCGRKCGRNLACGNHQCTRDCHKVKHAPNATDAGTNCRKCELECQRARPEGCPHICNKPCHADPCQECTQMIRIACHCALLQVYVECGKWIQSEGEQRETLGSCKNQCPKLMACGHRCFKICHSGACSESSSCKKKTKIYCGCKRKKKEFPCSDPNQIRKLSCDIECAQAKNKDDDEVKDLDPEERWRREAEARLQREELERFEKMKEGGKKRRRNRRVQSETVEQSIWTRHKTKILILSSLMALVVAMVAYKYL